MTAATSVGSFTGMIPKLFVDESYKVLLESLSFVDLYILIPASVSVGLVSDDLRDTDKKFIDRVNHHFLRVLFELSRESRINVKVISGGREERLEQVKKIV